MADVGDFQRANGEINGQAFCSHRMSAGERPKRQLADEPKSAFQDVIEDLQGALTTKRRLACLHRLRQFLGLHSTAALATPDSMNHIRLFVENGVLSLLILHLGHVLQRHGSTIQEAEQLLAVVDWIVRYCPDDANRLVTPDTESQHFLELLFVAMQRTELVPLCSSILHSVSGTRNGSSIIVYCRAALLKLLKQLRDQSSDKPFVLESLGLLKNITFHMEQERKMLATLPGFVLTLSQLCGPLQANEKIRERLSSIFQNLSLSSDCRRLLLQSKDFLNGAIELSSSTSPRVVRNLLNLFLSLAMERDSVLTLIFHGDGLLLNILKRWITESGDNTIRKRALRTLRLLATEASAPLLVHRSDLMLQLSQIALNDQDHAVRHEAVEAFARCAGLAKAKQPNYDCVVEALVQLAKAPISADTLACVLKEQAMHEENRYAMAHRDDVLRLLTNIATSRLCSRGAREDCLSALLWLSGDDRNLDALLSEHVLHILVEKACSQEPADNFVQDKSMVILTRLAAHSSNRPKMLSHENLLQALILFAATSMESQTKDDVKKAILLLVQEL